MPETYEQWKLKCLQPVDLEKVDQTIQRFIDGKSCRMSIPANYEDNDIILSRTMQELERYRNKFGIIDWSKE